MPQKFYAVTRGRRTGIFYTWDECRQQTDGFSKSVFKKFDTQHEAEEFLKNSKIQAEFISNPKIGIQHPRLKNDLPDQTSSHQFVPFKRPRFDKNPVQYEKNISDHMRSVKKSKISDFNSIQHNQLGDPIVYTDGACSENGKRNAQAGIGVFWAIDHPNNVSRKLNGKPTNNRAEIKAAIVALETALENGYRTLDIHTDSKFMIDAMTKWIDRWKQNGWKLSNGESVKNKPDWIRLDKLKDKMDRLIWTKVKGHSGNYGNEQADQLATNAIQNY